MNKDDALAFLELQDFDVEYIDGDYTDHIQYVVPPTFRDVATHDKQPKLSKNVQKIVDKHNAGKPFKGKNTYHELVSEDIYRHQSDSSGHVNQIVLLRLSLWQYLPGFFGQQMTGGNENVTDMLYHLIMMQGYGSKIKFSRNTFSHTEQRRSVTSRSCSMLYESTWEFIRNTNQTTEFPQATAQNDDWDKGNLAATSYLAKKQLDTLELDAHRALDNMLSQSAGNGIVEDYSARVEEEE